jgi:hypothetical protein
MRYWADTLERFLAQRDNLEPNRVLDLPYLEIRRDPIAAVRRVYQHFDWTLAGEAEDRMRALLAAQPRDQVGFHRYDPAQFGLATDEMSEYFADYCRRFDLPVEEDQSGERSPARVTSHVEEYSLGEEAVQSRAAIG